MPACSEAATKFESSTQSPTASVRSSLYAGQSSVTPEHAVQWGLLVPRALQALQAHAAHRAQLAPRDLPVLKDLREKWGLPDLQGRRVLRARMAQRVQQDRPGLRVRKESRQ